MKGAWLVVACILLAGCSDGAGDAPPRAAGAAAPDGEVGDALRIEGEVLTRAFVPIAGALVSLDGGEPMMTGADGAFAFDVMEPGVHRLEAIAEGYVTGLAEVEVMGLAKVRFELPIDPSAFPYFEEQTWSGYVECGTNLVAACSFLAQAGVSTDDYTHLFDVDNNITHLQAEMTWEDTQQLGDRLESVHRWATVAQAEAGTFEGVFEAVQGPSPLLHVTPADAANNVNLGTQHELQVAIFAGDAGDTGLPGVALLQEFEVFLHVFHGYEPPDGWRFTTDPRVPPP